MCRESQPLLHPFQGRKAGTEASCCPATSQQEQEVEKKDPVWIWCLETHGETTISSKLCICWSSAAALTSRACALLDPYVILCNWSQDPTVGFVGPRQERAPEPKRFPGSYNQVEFSFLPAETSLSFPPLSHLPGSSNGDKDKDKDSPATGAVGKRVPYVEEHHGSIFQTIFGDSSHSQADLDEVHGEFGQCREVLDGFLTSGGHQPPKQGGSAGEAAHGLCQDWFARIYPYWRIPGRPRVAETTTLNKVLSKQIPSVAGSNKHTPAVKGAVRALWQPLPSAGGVCSLLPSPSLGRNS